MPGARKTEKSICQKAVPDLEEKLTQAQERERKLVLEQRERYQNAHAEQQFCSRRSWLQGR